MQDQDIDQITGILLQNFDKIWPRNLKNSWLKLSKLCFKLESEELVKEKRRLAPQKVVANLMKILLEKMLPGYFGFVETIEQLG